MADTAPAEPTRRVRSPPYPSISLGKALDRVKRLHAKALHHPVGVKVLADAWDYQVKSSGLWATAAALMQYGFLTDEGSGDKRKFTLTDKALRIVRDPNPESEKRLAVIKQAALAPKIFKELWASYGTAKAMSDMIFKSHLTVDRYDRGLAPYGDAAADEVIKAYKETISFAKLSDSDTLPAGSEEKEPDGEGTDTSQETPEPGLSVVRDLPPLPPVSEDQGKVAIMAGERIVFTEESAPQQYLKIVASGDVDEALLDALEDYVRRQKKRLGISPQKKEAAN